MSVHVRQYRPAFFEGFDTWEGEVDTVEELLALPFIKRWSENKAGPAFTRFSLSHYAPEVGQYNLMAELDNNREWWVIAILKAQADHPIVREMPQWHSPGEKTP
jgi:hypothetical protein